MIPASPIHGDALAAIHQAAFGAAAWSTSSLSALLQDRLVFGFIAPEGGMVLARAVAEEAEILTIGVARSARRIGLGTALLLAAIAEARFRGAETMFLEVAATNQAAIALYRRCGFIDAARRRDYYGAGEDALLLRCPLCGSPE